MQKSNRSFARRILGLALVTFIAVASYAKPRVFVVQTYAIEAGESLQMLSVMADQLDRLGQVTPITWSMTEPEVRNLDSSGAVAFSPIKDEDTAHLVAKALHCDYVLLIAAFKGINTVRPFAKLSSTGDPKVIWHQGSRDWNKDTKLHPSTADKTASAANFNYFDQVNVTVSGAMDWEDTARTLASTWADQLAKGPFKRIPISLRPDPVVQNVSLPGLVFAPATMDELKSDRYNNQPSLRLVALRDLMDREPERSDVRVALYDESLKQLDYSGATEIALVSAKTFDTEPDWHLRAAHALVLDGKYLEAKKEAEMAGPEQLAQPSHAALLGDIELANSDYHQAIQDYSRAIQIRPTPEALIGRAVSYALAGDTEASKKDLSAVIDAPGTRAIEGYRVAIKGLQQAVFGLGRGMSDLIPAIRLRSGTPEVIAKSQTYAFRAAALGELVDHLPLLAIHKHSLSTLALACKLLDQAAQETLSFAQAGDEESGTEAGMTLGESMASYRASVTYFEDEISPD